MVLGAGYAGLTLSTRLDKRLENKEITLIDANKYHDLIQQAHLVAAGIKTKEETRLRISKIVKNTNIKFINSFAKKVNAEVKKVILEDKEIVYDLLVVALGATTQSFGIKKATEYGYTLRSIDDALKIKNKIQQIINNDINGNVRREEANKSKDKGKDSNSNISNNKTERNAKDLDVDKKDIIIVGGGPTGVGIAGTIAELVQNSKSDKVKITVVTASATILPGMPEKMIGEATEILKRKGIDIITDSIVSDVIKDGITLKDGQKISSSMTIWTPGVKGFELPFEPEIEKTKDGRIVVNEFCQVNNYPEIFCIGDIGAIKGPSGEIKDPTLGQIAISQAIYLAEIIPEYLKGKKPQNGFDFKPHIRILPMGAEDYIGTANGNLIIGNIAKILKEFRYKSYKREITSDETIINDILYKDDPLANILLGISIDSAISDKIKDIDRKGKEKKSDFTDKVKDISKESKDISKTISE